LKVGAQRLKIIAQRLNDRALRAQWD